jgi:L-aspartate oxidase
MQTDFLVIGSGIAGLNFALLAAEHGRVVLVTKKEIMESNTNQAQGGIAAVMAAHDSVESHVADTLRTGCGLCDERAVRVLAKAAPGEIKRLIAFGVGFNREHGELSLTREGGHSERRIVFAGDATGREIERALVFNVRRTTAITVLENHFALDLELRDGACVGAQVLDAVGGRLAAIGARVVVLAAGGSGQLYAITSNPAIATGDGLAMAWRAGAVLEDMEFVQFHPTTFNRRGKPHMLISETVRGEGAVLKDARGRPFMKRYHAMADLAPRDIVSRAVFAQMERGPVYLDISHKDAAFIKRRFPTIYERCLEYGVDMTRAKIPVAPAAHYMCGGIRTDTYGRTSVKGLLALGECACTGVHGANRLASNSLSESLVFGTRAIGKAVAYAEAVRPSELPPAAHRLVEPAAALARGTRRLQRLMWRHVGIVRTEAGLDEVIAQLERKARSIEKQLLAGINVPLLELRNMATVGLLIARAARWRTESRGTHFMAEDPDEDPAFLTHHRVRRQP